ncbi:MAG: beta-ketoacyl synthase N-terminal-like domain-containing protein [bacterium]|nr:beta-ketoacyl synthase N-terminal-like domain-containing protein [bacterium]
MAQVYVAKVVRLPFAAVEQVGKLNFKNYLMKKLLKSGKVAKEDLSKAAAEMMSAANKFLNEAREFEEMTGLSINAEYPPNEGHFSEIPAAELALIMIDALFKDFGQDSARVRELVDVFNLGTVISHKTEKPAAHAFAKVIALRSGMKRAHSLTEDKACSSGLKAIGLAFDAVANHGAEFAVAGGVEKMSGVPDSFVRLGLTDPFSGKLMAGLADEVAKEQGLTRKELDDYAYGSYERAEAWQGKHRFIAPVRVSESLIVERDEEVDKYRVGTMFRKILSNLATYPESEKEGASRCGLVTPGNSAKYADGGGLVLLTNRDGLRKLKLDPLARVLAYAEASGSEPKNFILKPEEAIGKCLMMSGLSWKDIGHFGVNEAFGVGNVLLMKMHDIARDCMNRRGGAIARGHAIGGTLGGTPVIATDIALCGGDQYYVEGACNAVDEGTAMLFENMNV